MFSVAPLRICINPRTAIFDNIRIIIFTHRLSFTKPRDYRMVFYTRQKALRQGFPF